MLRKKDALAAVYRTHSDLDDALKRLKNWGFNLRRVSIVGRGYVNQEQLVGCYLGGGRMKHWGELGAFWDEYWRLLCGGAFFAVPGMGPMLVAGPLVSSIVAALKGEELATGLSAIGAGCMALGIPRDEVDRYETLLRAGSFLLIVQGAVEEVTESRDLLQQSQAERVEVCSNAVQPVVGASHFFG